MHACTTRACQLAPPAAPHGVERHGTARHCLAPPPPGPRRLYLRHRRALWCGCAVLRASTKLVQLAGLLTTPPSTLEFFAKGVTLVTDVWLPATFEQVGWWVG